VAGAIRALLDVERPSEMRTNDAGTFHRQNGRNVFARPKSASKPADETAGDWETNHGEHGEHRAKTAMEVKRLFRL
jgi:hypothetical protein